MNAISDWIGEHYEKVKSGWFGLGRTTSAASIAQDLTAIAFTPTDDGDKTRAFNAWKLSMDYGKTKLGAFGETISPVTDFPVISQLGAGLSWLQKTAVNRPLATGFLALRDSDPYGITGIPTDPGAFLDAGTWRKAWNDSRRVTAGQAITYNSMASLGLVDPDDPNYDPRISKEEYYNDWFYQTTSGTLDFSLALVDPLRGAGKLATFGKLKLIDKALSESQVAKGGLERQTLGANAKLGQSFEEVGELSPGAQKLYDQAEALPEETFNRLYFNQYTYGGVVSTALSAAAKTGSKAMFADVIMAARGSYAATERITKSEGGAALADAIGRQRNVYNTVRVQERAVDDPFAWEVSEARRQSAIDAWMDQITLGSPTGTPEFGTLQGVQGALLGRGMPKVRPVFDAFREGVHQYANGAYAPVQIASWKSALLASLNPDKLARNAARIFDRSRGYASHLDVNFVGSYRAFRQNLERAGKYIDDETRNKYVTAYMAALTANERARIAGIADNYVIGQIASEHKMTTAEVERLLRDASLRRQNFRTMLNAQEKFIPHEFKKRADYLLKSNAYEEAQKLQLVAQEYQKLIDAGAMPAYADFTVDYRGRLLVVPRVDVQQPMLTSQVADYLPMVDYDRFNRALQRFAKPRKTIERYESDQQRIANGELPEYPEITEAMYKEAKTQRRVSAVAGTAGDVYEALNYVWSVAAVLRPAQTLRTLADDGMRSVTMIGMIPSIMNGSVGLGRIGYNLTRRGTMWMQDRRFYQSLRASRGQTHHDIDIDEVHAGTSAAETPSESAGFYNYIDPETSASPTRMGDTLHYDSLEAALVDGQIDLATYVAFVPWAARQGRVPHDLEALVEEYAGGLRGFGPPGTKRFREEAAIFAMDKFGKITDYNREAVVALATYALDKAGRAGFANPRWQADVLETVNVLGFRKRSRESNGIVVNPFDDEIKTATKRTNDEYEFITHTYLHRNPETNLVDDADGLYDFVANNIDKFLAGGYRLHIKHAVDGRIRLSVVRPKNMPRPFTERLNAAEKEQVLKGLKARGSDGVRFVSGRGKVVIPGAFSGTDGGYARSTVSASYAPYNLVRAQRNAERGIQWNNKVSKKDVTAYVDDPNGKPVPNKDYDPAWERTVNFQLANDEVARQFLMGRSEAQIVDWLDSNDPQALRYANDRPRTGFTTDEHVATVRALVDYYVPPIAGQGIRDKILNQEGSAADLRKAVDKDMLPPVNGQVTEASLGTHPVLMWVKKRIDGWFRKMQDKPADFLIRFPFYETRYRGYFEPLWRNYVKQVDGEHITDVEIQRLARVARQKAMDDTQRYLYDATFRTDAAKALSSFMPFSNAIADSFFKWTKIFREKPFETLANWNLVYNWPERAGIVYDQDGNSLHYEDGKEVWRSKLDGLPMGDDVEHDKYVAFQPPSWIADKIPGGLKLVTFNKNSLTSAIFDPSVNVGPLVAFPVNKFALYHPEVGENQFVKTYVLPFGPTSDDAKALLPGLLRAAYTWYKEDESMASSSAMAIYQTQLTDILLNKRTTPPDIEEAKSQARHEQALRFMTSAASPVSFQYNSPYKPYVDMYSQLLRKYNGDDAKAMADFRALAGPEYLYLAARVTKSNIALPSTMKGYRNFKDKQDMIAKFPDLAGLITGGDGGGSFSKSVYEWEKRQTYDETGQTIREEQQIAESIADVEKRATWDEYMKFNALLQNDLSRRGLYSINTKGAEDLKNAYQTWIQAHMYKPGPNQEIEITPWYEDFRSIDGTKMENRLTEMRQILVMHPEWMQGRDDLQGLAKYLAARDEVKRTMTYYGYSALKPADEANHNPSETFKASWLQDQWDNIVFDLKQENVAFGQLYDRYLSRDNLTATGIASNDIIRMLQGEGALPLGI